MVDIRVLFDDKPDYQRVGNELRTAAESVGVFYVKNHCIPSELMGGGLKCPGIFSIDPRRKNPGSGPTIPVVVYWVWAEPGWRGATTRIWMKTQTMTRFGAVNIFKGDVIILLVMLGNL